MVQRRAGRAFAFAAIASAMMTVGTLVACGSFAADDGPTDAAAGDAALPPLALDASIDGPPPPTQACANALAFQPATLIDWTPTLSLKSARYSAGDGRWYVSIKNPIAQMHAATADAGELSNDDRFIDPIRSATSAEEQPMIAFGGRAIIFQSDRADAGIPELHLGVRSDVDAAFAGPVRLDVGAGFQAQDPYVVGADVYFAKQLGLDKATRQIHKGTIVSGAPPTLSGVVPLDTLGAASEDDHPVVTLDQLEIFWTSKRGDAGSAVFHASRPSVSAPFADVQPITVTSNATDLMWISDDGCDLYAIASSKLYVMTRRQ